MQKAADALNRVVAARGQDWTWVRCESGYVVHQGLIPFDSTIHRPGRGLRAYRNPVVIGTTAGQAIAWCDNNRD